MMKTLSAITLAAALTLAGLAAASPSASAVQLPQSLLNCVASVGEPMGGATDGFGDEFTLDPVYQGCLEAVSVDIWEWAPEAAPVYPEAIQEAIDAEREEGYVSLASIGFCTNPVIYETEDEQVNCIRNLNYPYVPADTSEETATADESDVVFSEVRETRRACGANDNILSDCWNQ